MKAIQDWERKTFNELGVCIRGVSYKPDDLRPAPAKENITLLRSNNIKDGRLNYDNLQFVNQSVVRELQKLQNDDIAICMSNGNRALVGKSGQFVECGDNAEYTVGAFCSIFRPANGFDASYIRHLFGSDKYQKQLDRILAGSAINNLKGSDIDGLIAFCPTSKPEQTKIAEVLSTVDRAIEQTEALIAKQQRIKTGLMQDLFTRGIDEHGNLRSEQTHEFKDSPLGRIPVEWEIRNLDRLTKAIIDCPHTTPKFTQDGILVARTFNIKNGQFLGERSYVSEAEYSDRILRLEPQQGDVIFTREAPVGEAYVILANFKVCLGQRTMLLRCDLNKCLPEYLVEVIYSEEMRNIFDQKVGGTTNPHLNVGDVRYLAIKQPPINEQQKIITLLGEVRRAFNWHSQDKSKLSSLKIALMQDLLTGKKRVTALLEKIS